MKNRLCVLGILGLGFLMTLGGWVNGSALPSNVNLKSMWGGNPNQQCFKSCDCGYGCRYNPNISKCEICVAPIGSTTEYICCVGGTEYCDYDPVYADPCGVYSTYPSTQQGNPCTIDCDPPPGLGPACYRPFKVNSNSNKCK